MLAEAAQGHHVCRSYTRYRHSGVEWPGEVPGASARRASARLLQLPWFIPHALLEFSLEGLHSSGFHYASRAGVVGVWFLFDEAVTAKELVPQVFQDLLHRQRLCQGPDVLMEFRFALEVWPR